MEVVFDVTDRFEKELSKCERSQQQRWKKAINRAAELFVSDRAGFFTRAKRFRARVYGDLRSSLFVWRLSNDWRLLFTVEEDPLFDRIVITLLSLANHDTFYRSLERVAESLYEGHPSNLAAEAGLYDE